MTTVTERRLKNTNIANNIFSDTLVFYHDRTCKMYTNILLKLPEGKMYHYLQKQVTGITSYIANIFINLIIGKSSSELP